MTLQNVWMQKTQAQSSLMAPGCGQTFLCALTQASLLETRLEGCLLLHLDLSFEVCEGQCFDFGQEFLRLFLFFLRDLLLTFGESVAE